MHWIGKNLIDDSGDRIAEVIYRNGNTVEVDIASSVCGAHRHTIGRIRTQEELSK